jgi:hypothetical protein
MMTNVNESHRTDDPAPSTPGRPRDTSRQQKHDEQNVQSGSDSLDRRSAGDGAAKPHPKLPGAK